ncbi:hypothetical protein [Halostella sp. PRR32]|uniref:hypothetical protein n=1 Tax=Halostella sp. PRR32 TaxID=3098147 RepID=UPI002B1CE2DA|nr:hypothetical protein [Halostella sp. PRR32]
MDPRRQCAVALAIGILLCGAAIVPSTATAAATDAVDPPPSDRDPRALSQADGQENNTSTPHENPSEAGEEGDVDDVSDWLTARLADQLGESTLRLSQEEYDAARAVVGDGYSDRLERLVDVEGETGSDGNDSSAFERAQENQQEFVSSAQAYRETRERYREAKRNGNESGARRLARTLDRIAGDVNNSGSGLRTDYRIVSNRTDRDLTAESREVANITENVTATQREIREVEFVETTLTVERRSRTVSFSDPLAVTGRVTTANASALDNETVVLQFGDRRRRATTNATGHFDLMLRPTVQPLDTRNATVRFVPSDASIYLGAAENVTVELSQETPTVTLDETPSDVAFDESAAVTGSVSVDGDPVGAVPVEIRVGGVPLGQTRTDDDGTFSLTTPLPATVPTGDRRINASLPFRERALSSTAAEAAVTVRKSDTSITLSASQSGAERINVTGRLTAVDGTAVADQRVELRVNGSVVDTVRTDDNGRYETAIAVPPSVLDDGSGRVRLAAVYSVNRTNLADARASTNITVSGTAERTQLLPTEWRRFLQVALVIAMATVGSGLLWRRRRTTSDPSNPAESAASGENAVETPVRDPDPTDEPSLDGARAALESGRPDEAVELTYGDVRRRLSGAFDVPPVRTHWEFYRACEAAGIDGEAAGLLERLTEAYERAAYAPTGFSESEVDAIIDAVETTEISTAR